MLCEQYILFNIYSDELNEETKEKQRQFQGRHHPDEMLDQS